MLWDAGATETILWLRSAMADLNLESRADSFTFWRNNRWVETANIEVDITGQSHPEQVVLVGAHWDTIDWVPCIVEGDSSTRVFGADDNASGVASLVELARLLKDLHFEKTIRIIFFAAEEVGLKGSYRNREHWRDPSVTDSLICLINVDMVGYDPDDLDARVLCRMEEADLATEAVEAARQAVNEIDLDTMMVSIAQPHGSSDHLPYWYIGLPAMLLHEGPEDANPNANHAGDLPDLINPVFHADCTRALVAMVMQLAVPITEPPPWRLP
jgi:hypothetical protein